MRYYSIETVFRLIHDGAEKCRRNIEFSRNDKELDGAIGLCNAYSNAIVAILNNEDHRFIARRFNRHRKWCADSFEVLQAAITELDGYITERRDQISKDSGQDGRIGFNS